MPLCNIRGNIADSGATVMDGRLVVTLQAPIVDDSTTPDTYYSTYPKTFEIVGGVININLPESETSRVSYRFQFYQKTGASTYSPNPKPDFYAVVPNAADYEWGQLAAPTGITNDGLASGALRVAKTIFSDPTLIPLIANGVGIYRQNTVPPGAAGRVWIKLNEGTIWFWNATLNRWQSAPYMVQHLFQTTTGGRLAAPIQSLLTYRDILVTSVKFRAVVNAPNDAANYWNYNAGWKDASATLNSVPYFATGGNTAALAASSVQNNSQTFSRQLDLNQVESFAAATHPTGSPGELRLHITYAYSFLHPTS